MPPCPLSRRGYVERILDLYRRTPGTSGIARPADRRLAASLHDRHVPLDVVHAALLLAACRRIHRPADAPPLAKIATFHYFLPVIDELLAAPLDPGYFAYLRHKLAGVAPDLASSATGHRLP